jgi:hypothetical protein
VNGRPGPPKLLTKDEARRIAANITKLLDCSSSRGAIFTSARTAQAQKKWQIAGGRKGFQE